PRPGEPQPAADLHQLQDPGVVQQRRADARPGVPRDLAARHRRADARGAVRGDPADRCPRHRWFVLRHPEASLGSRRGLTRLTTQGGTLKVKRFLKVMVAGATLAVTGALVGAVPAGATPPTGYGFDNTAHIISGGGS